MAAHGFVSNESKLQAENDGLRLQLANLTSAARNVQDTLRRLWSQHERAQLQIQQLEKELSREKELRAKGSREAWADERSVPDGVRPASAPERKAATHAPEVGNAPQEPACVQSIRKRAADAIRSRAEAASNKKKTGAAKREDTPTWKAQSWLADGSSAKLAELGIFIIKHFLCRMNFIFNFFKFCINFYRCCKG